MRVLIVGLFAVATIQESEDFGKIYSFGNFNEIRGKWYCEVVQELDRQRNLRRNITV